MVIVGILVGHKLFYCIIEIRILFQVKVTPSQNNLAWNTGNMWCMIALYLRHWKLVVQCV